jgi:hypothetical protein
VYCNDLPAPGWKQHLAALGARRTAETARQFAANEPTEK